MGRLLRTIQTNFTSGELDPRLKGRIDIKHYYNGGERVRNVNILPQGGVKRRPGLEYIDTIAYQITRISSGITPTAPEGGTASNANDDDEATLLTTTGAIGTVDPYVVVHYDLGSAKVVKFADVRGLKVDAGTSAEFRIQSSVDDAAWLDVGTPFDAVSTSPINRRRRSEVNARFWRVVKIGGTDMTTAVAELNSFNLWEEGTTLSEPRMIEFDFNIAQRYVLVVTNRNISVWLNDVLQADIHIPHTEAQTGEISWVQSLDTVIIYHEAVQTHRLLRSGAHDEWNDNVITFGNLPTDLFERSIETANNLTLGSKDIGTGVTCTAATAIFASNMVGWVIRNKKDTEEGFARITSFTSTTVVEITIHEAFTATAVGEWQLEEVIWSSARGWPKTGTFHEGRLWQGGSTSLPNAFGGSSIFGGFFDFEEGDGLADAAIIVRLDSDEVADIYNIYSGRHLQIFTSTSEFYVLPNDEPITPETIVVKRTSTIGSEGPGLRVVNIEGATLFLQQGGKSVREFLFTDLEQAYSAQNISLLSSHLINSPNEVAVRRSTSTDEGDLYYIVNGDGTLAVLQTLRIQEITGWTQHQTTGKFKSVMTLGGATYFAVERTINGTPVHYLEKYNNDHFMDASTRITSGLPTSSFSGLDHLETETVKVRADDAMRDPVTISGGNATLDEDVTTGVEFGFDFPDLTGDGDGIWVKDMPVEPNLPEGTVQGKKKRVVSLDMEMFETQGWHVRANDGNTHEMNFRQLGSELLDQPAPISSGQKTIAGLLGYTKTGQVEYFQKEPAPFTLLNTTKTVSI